MIDDDHIRSLIEALESDDDPAHHRLLVDALTALPLSDSAWRDAAPTVQRALAPLRIEEVFAPDVSELAARVPLRSVRQDLRTGAQDIASPLALGYALALAEVGDDAGVSTLVRALEVSPNEAVARALAILPLEQSSVSAADLSPGLRMDDQGESDDATRMWTAIALARLRDFEALEELWDALVRPPEFFAGGTRRYLFREPPPLFQGDPARTVSALARVRPLPERMVAFVLGLRDNDYDERWTPRNPESVGDARNPILLVAGLTGVCDQYGNPVTAASAEEEDLAAPHDVAAATKLATRLRVRPWRGFEPNVKADKLRLLRFAPPELSAEVMESGLARLDVAGVATARVPGYALGNALVGLAAALPLRFPVRVARALRTPVVKFVPEQSLAWALARAGGEAVVTSLTPCIVASEGKERTEWLTWLGRLARQLDAPAPILGAGGMEAVRLPVMDLVDDMAKASAKRSSHRNPPVPTREVYPDIATDTPSPVASEALTLTVSLGDTPSGPTRGSVRVFDRDPTEVFTMRVHLLLGAHTAWDTLTWSAAAGTTKAATFTLTTPGVSGERALVEARVSFYLNHRWCGEGSRNLDVRRGAGVAPLADIALPPQPPWCAGLALETDAVPPDLTVRIQREKGVGEYTWTCDSPHVEFHTPADPLATHMALEHEDAATFVRRTFGPLANIPLNELKIGAVQGAGEKLYRTTPSHFKDCYWAVWHAAAAGEFPFESIQIVTDEPCIPWELMRIRDPKRGVGVKAEFLAIRHSVGRWLADESAGPPQRIQVSDVVVAASDYVGIAAVSNELSWAKEEREMLVTTHHARAVPLTSHSVMQLLESGCAQAVHFACHGRMSIADPDASLLVMEDTPDDVTPALVAREEVCDGLGVERPLVFLNACEVGGSGAALSLVAGFPGAFLYAGASALISPLWVINDRKACEIAKGFYDTVLSPAHRTPIGQILRDVRKRWVQEKHLTYLAYVLYGDPLAWIDYTPPATSIPQPPSP